MRCLFFVGFLLVGTMSFGATNSGHSQTAPTIQGYSDPIFVNKLYSIAEVNGKDAAMKWTENTPLKLIGNRNNLVSGFASFRKGAFSQSIYVRFQHVFFARNGQHYQVKGYAKANKITTWIADSHGKAVSRHITKEALNQGETEVDIPTLER